MLHVMKIEVFIRGGRGGEGWGTRPPLSEFSESAPGIDSNSDNDSEFEGF